MVSSTHASKLAGVDRGLELENENLVYVIRDAVEVNIVFVPELMICL